MKPSRGYYAIVQYCPDPSRAEAANVGVILFAPERGFIDVRSAKGHDRERRFFQVRAGDLERIEAAKHSLESRIRLYRDDFKTIEDLRDFAATRANELLIVPPRPIVVTEPEKQLDELFSELVGGRATTPPPQRLRQELDQAFKYSELGRRMKFNVPVQIPVVGRSIKVPYTYQNGRVNLIYPQHFPETRNEATDIAMRLAAEGGLFDRYAQKNLIVVGELPPESADALTGPFEQIFRDFQSRFIPSARLGEFVREVEVEAH
jgi:hypothetical protein